MVPAPDKHSLARSDFEDWRQRLHVYGIDFRDLAAVESFCAWLRTKLTRLDILINNACQTIRRPAQYYEHLMPGERRRLDQLPPSIQEVLAGHDALRASSETASRPVAIAAGQGGEIPSSFVEMLDPAAEDACATAAASHVTATAAVPEPRIAKETSGASASTTDQDSIRPERTAPEAAKELSRRPDGIGGGVGAAAAEMSQLVVLPEDAAHRPDLFPQRADGGGALVDVNAQQVDLRRHNSWMLKLHEVGAAPLRLPCDGRRQRGPVMHSLL
jgi:NAD(P)-dependent dehydrogenase (short-subunit alcohol dehydrogenase family)